MVYKTISELSELVRSNLYKVPHDIDLVVGIPRSGMLPAMMISLYLNKKVTDLDSFIEGRTFESGERSQYIQNKGCRKVLIIDDSVCSGNAILKAKKKLEPIENSYELVYLAPIVTSQGKNLVDLYFEIIDDVRVFEWNLFHHGILENTCLDIDGVLNVDPTFDTDDDGSTYINFLKNAIPLFIPTAPIHTLISCRLEKYRKYTEDWLEKYNVRYSNLIMLDLPSKVERLKWNKHGEYKAQYYKAHSNLCLFIESSKEQANVIAAISHKPVICVETNELIYIPLPPKRPSLFKRIKRYVRKRYPVFYAKLQDRYKAKY